MKKLNLLAISLVFLLIFTKLPYAHTESMNLPKDYNQSLDLDQPLIYRFENVNETSNYVEFWEEGTFCALEKGGSMELTFNGVYNKTLWDMVLTEPFFNITFKYADGSVNCSLTNISNNAIANALILSIYPWCPGIITTINWTYHDETAESIASSEPMEGALNISSENGLRTYDYVQNGEAQKTMLIYNETSGVIDNWITSFGSYYLEAGPQREDIPSYPIVSIFGFSILAAILVSGKIRRSRKNKNSISKF